MRNIRTIKLISRHKWRSFFCQQMMSSPLLSQFVQGRSAHSRMSLQVVTSLVHLFSIDMVFRCFFHSWLIPSCWVYWHYIYYRVRTTLKVNLSMFSEFEYLWRGKNQERISLIYLQSYLSILVIRSVQHGWPWLLGQIRLNLKNVISGNLINDFAKVLRLQFWFTIE